MCTKKYLFSDYSKNQRNGLQGWGNGLIDALIEKYSPTKKNLSILELGGSSGEHIEFIEQGQLYTWQKYVVIDLYPGKTDQKLFKKMLSKKVEFVSANIEQMPFKNKTFDLVISTCVFAHINNPEKALREVRRVLKSKGQFIVALPCDPGIMNRFIKVLITYPQMRRNGITNPRLQYARDHINPVGNLIVLLKFVFAYDKIKTLYFPFRIKSWNINLVAIMRIAKNG